jgi:glycosyltransferase involved in cell wall biosynthesis
MPTVILEAMACGCAIIATDVGATNTMVNNDNGWLIQGDIVSGLMKSVQKAVNATNKEIKLKKKCSLDKVKSNFTWGKVIHKTIKALKN